MNTAGFTLGFGTLSAIERRLAKLFICRSIHKHSAGYVCDCADRISRKDAFV